MGSIGIFNSINGSEKVCETFNLDYYIQFTLDDKDCCPGGMLLQDAPAGGGVGVVLLLLQLIFLCYIFLGVALGADTFMASIEVITSKESSKEMTNKTTGEKQVVHVRVWNATVANLTLMALGSSAPEILLSIIEVIAEGMATGPLGPSTIVGSAAFNLMIITAVCVIALPDGETRTLKQLGVFLTTAAYSVWAYVWLMIIVIFWTPQVITVTEGVLTLVFFALLVVNAYGADKYGQRAKEKSTWSRAGGVNSKDAAAILKSKGLSKDASPEEIAAALKAEVEPPKTKAYYRRQQMKELEGKVGKAKVAPYGGDMDAYGDGAATSSTAAKQPAEGYQARPEVEVDKEDTGILAFQQAVYKIPESDGSIDVFVVRKRGSKGKMVVEYATKDQKTCVAGKDYIAVSGELVFEDGDTEPKKITIKIIDDDEFEKDEHFTVVLTNATCEGSAIKFAKDSDGGEEEEICTVMILNDDDRAAKLSLAMRMLKFDSDVLDVASEDYWSAVGEVFSWPEGGTKTKVMHVLTFPWQFMFKVLVPPAGLCNGWPCFVLALIWIGFQVVLISDFATQMGCQMYLPDTITAITFVALGTSLPDTFASMQAARQDKTADSSVGNVTGSNSVNVFLGLGLPWLIGAAFWAISGPTAAWHEKYGPIDLVAVVNWQVGLPVPTGMVWEDYPTYKDSAAFFVSKTGLGFSVLVFTFFALCTIAIILLRRQLSPPAELGGKKSTAKLHAGCMVMFWLLYVTLSCLSDPQWATIKVDL